MQTTNPIRIVPPNEPPSQPGVKAGRVSKPAAERRSKPVTVRRIALGLVWWLMHVVMLPVLGIVGGLYGGMKGAASGFGGGVDEAHAAIAKWRRMMDRN